MKNIVGKAVGKVVEGATDVTSMFSNKEQVTKRLDIDMDSDSRITKAIRPIITLWAMILFTYQLIGEQVGVVFSSSATTTINWLLFTCVGFYMVGRTAEKINKEAQQRKINTDKKVLVLRKELEAKDSVIEELQTLIQKINH